MRIGIIGAQGVGKSKLIEALVEEEEFKNYVHVPSPTRYLMKMFGMDFSNANTEIQLATLCMQMYNTMQYENAFYDRTVLDNYAYLQYHAGKGNSDLSGRAQNFIRYFSYELAKKLDFIFIIKKEFEIEDDGVRNIDPVMQKQIEENILQVLMDFDIDINKMFYLTGTIEQRVLTVKRIMNLIGDKR